MVHQGVRISSRSFTTPNNLEYSETEYTVEVRAEQTSTTFYSSSAYYSENVSTTAVLPDPPTITSVIYDGSTLSVTWNSVTEATGYSYFVSVFPDQTSIITATDTTSLSFSTSINVDEDTATYMRIGVASSSSAGTSSYTHADRALKLRTPTGLRGDGKSRTTIDVVWNAVSSSTSFTTGSSLNITGTIMYEVTISPNDDSLSPTSSTSASFTGLTDNTEYTISVKATLDGYGDSDSIGAIITTGVTNKTTSTYYYKYYL